MQSLSLPYFASVEEINQKIQQGEIEKWEIDPKLQYLDNPNTRISFFSKDGKLYLVTAQYNPTTNQILPPVPVIPKGTLVEPQLINWEKTSKIFNDELNITPNIPNGYCDSEIDGKVSPDYFNSIFQAIDSFQPEVYTYKFKQISTRMGKQCALLKQWTNRDGRIEYWVTDDGYAIIFGTPNTFLIVGNFNDHPFVYTPDWTFDNSDGSTGDDVDYPSLNLDQVKHLLKIKAVEYTFDQIH
jgi:hypothetical protein